MKLLFFLSLILIVLSISSCTITAINTGQTGNLNQNNSGETNNLDSFVLWVDTLAGSGTEGYTDANGTNAQFYSPYDIASDSYGNIYVADTLNNTIRKITPSGDVTTFAGNGTMGYADGNGTNARFFWPQGIAIDQYNNLFVSDCNNVIRKITPSGTVTTIAGNGYSISGYVDANGTNALFCGPGYITVDRTGNIYVVDQNATCVRKISTSYDVTTLAGSAGNSGFLDAKGTNARFNNAQGIAADKYGNVYIGDCNNNRVRKITSGGDVTTLAGSSTSGHVDATGTAARFYNPWGLRIDNLDNLYLAELNNRDVRKITLSGVVTTYAGGYYVGNGNVGGLATNASFQYPRGIALDSSGTVYVSETSPNQCIRRIYYRSTN